ncbi:MAG: hypothetical protein WCR51_00450 [Planctomycetia bacterium]
MNGSFSLTANSTGATLFSAAVGGGTALTSLTTDAGGTVSLKSVTTSGAQQYGDNATLNGTHTTTNSAFSVAGTTTLAGTTTVSTGTGSITFTGIVNGAQGLTANSTGNTLFSANVGSGTSLTSLTTNAGGTVSLQSVTTTGAQQYGDNATLNGTYTTTNSAFSVAGTTTLAGTTTVSTGTGSIAFTGIVNGAQALTANSTGTTLFSAAVGGSSALTSLTTDAGGTVSLQSATTAGAQQYGDNATLNGTYTTTNSAFSIAGTTTLAGTTTVSTGSGSITFTGTVNGAYALTANSTGATLFSAAVGSGTSLASLTTNAGGTVSLQSVTTTGAQQFGDNATLNGTYTTTNSAFSIAGTTTLAGTTTVSTGSGSITFTGIVNGAQALTANSTGTTLFSANVGSGTSLTSLTTNAGGTVSLQSVTTSGAQQYGDNATLNGTYTTTNSAFSIAGTTTLAGTTAVSTGSGSITFTGTVNGAYALTANSTGATLFSAAVGSGTSLASLTTNAGGTVSLQSVTTSGAQQYGDNATLNGTYTTTDSAFSVAGTTTLAGTTTVSTGSGSITFTGIVNGAQTLTANSTGTTLFSAAVGGGIALTSLTTNTGGTVSLQSVTTSGVQQYGDNATLNGTYTTTNSTFSVAGSTTLAGNTTVSTGSGSITFTGIVNGAQALTANSTGTTLFSANVGSGTSLTSLTTNAGGTVSLLSVTTTGAQQYGDHATLNGTYTTTDSAFSVAGTTTLAGTTTVSTGIGNITFAGAVDGTYGLTANSTGATLFSANVGSGTSLASLTTNAGGTVSLQSVTTSGAQQYGDNATLNGTYTTTDSAFTVAGTTTLTGTTTVSTGNGDIDFKQSLNGSKTIDLAAGTGTVFFRAAVGDSAPLAGMQIRSAARVTAFSTIALDGVAKLSADGLSIGANVNNVSMTTAGSNVRNFSGRGVVFAGTSTGSTLSRFTISNNGGDGIAAGTGRFGGSVISLNTISANAQNGVSLTGSTGWKVSENTISNNGVDGVVVSGVNADDNTIFSNSIFLNGGKGISLRNDGNDAQVAPRLLSASLIGSAQVIRVRGIMNATAGTYRVQLFANRPADEIGFPANRSGFEGRQVLPLGDGTSLSIDVTVSASGQQEFFADVPLVAATTLNVKIGDWITATATVVSASVTKNTSEFSSGVQLGLPVLAAGSDGSNTAGDVTVPGARLYGIGGSQADVVLNVGPTLANAGSNITFDGVYGSTFPASFAGGMRVARVDVDGDGYQDLVTAPGELPTFSFTIVRASTTLTIPGNVLSLAPKGTTLVITPQFPALGAPVSRTVTAVTMIKGNTVISLNAPIDTVTIAGRVEINIYGRSLQKIGVFNGSPESALAWRFVTLDVAGVFGTSYTGGFVVAAGELQGNTSAIPQIIVAPTSDRAAFNGAAAFTVAAATRGAQPVVVTTPTLRTPAVAGAITGLAVGSFSTPVDCSTVGPASVAMAAATGVQTSVTVFGRQGGSLVQQNSFVLKLDLNRGDGVMMNVFGAGASLAAGDIDGDLRSELIVAAGKSGMSNFRVIPGGGVLGGNQQAIDAALTAGAGQAFSAGTTGGRFFGSTTVNNKINQIQQENLDYWYGNGAAQGKPTVNVAGGFNAALSVAVADAEGKGRSQVFAALGAFNTTANGVVAFSFDTTQTNVAKRWSRKECFKALSPSGISFASGMGLRLG